MSAEGESPWQTASQDVLIDIFSCLNTKDKAAAALACKQWSSCFGNSSLWKDFTFRFRSQEDTKQLFCVENYGNHLRSVKIYIDQREKKNCENAATVLRMLAQCSERRLRSLLISFTEENPAFFQGKNIIDALAELFGPPDPNSEMVYTLKEVNLSGLSIAINELLLKLLASNHPELEVLNIQSSALTCHVSPNGLIEVVRKCPKLKQLHCYSLSTADDLLQAFMEADHCPIELLSLLCRRDEKFHVPLSNDVWASFKKKLPNAKISLLFDETIEQDDIKRVLQPAIPLVSLSLRTMCELHNEVALVDRFYSDSLERFEIITKGSDEFQSALLSLLKNSPKLNEVHCLCGLSGDTLRKIKMLKPNMKKYTLKTESEFREMVQTFDLVGYDASQSAIVEVPGVFENLVSVMEQENVTDDVHIATESEAICQAPQESQTAPEVETDQGAAEANDDVIDDSPISEGANGESEAQPDGSLTKLEPRMDLESESKVTEVQSSQDGTKLPVYEPVISTQSEEPISAGFESLNKSASKEPVSVTESEPVSLSEVQVLSSYEPHIPETEMTTPEVDQTVLSGPEVSRASTKYSNLEEGKSDVGISEPKETEKGEAQMRQGTNGVVNGNIKKEAEASEDNQGTKAASAEDYGRQEGHVRGGLSSSLSTQVEEGAKQQEKETEGPADTVQAISNAGPKDNAGETAEVPQAPIEESEGETTPSAPVKVEQAEGHKDEVKDTLAVSREAVSEPNAGFIKEEDVPHDTIQENPITVEESKSGSEPSSSFGALNIALAVGVCTVAVMVSIFIARSAFAHQ